MKVALVLIAVMAFVLTFAGCGYLPIPQLSAGQRYIVELDQASAIANNDDDSDDAERRDRRLRGS